MRQPEEINADIRALLKEHEAAFSRYVELCAEYCDHKDHALFLAMNGRAFQISPLKETNQ